MDFIKKFHVEDQKWTLSKKISCRRSKMDFIKNFVEKIKNGLYQKILCRRSKMDFIKKFCVEDQKWTLSKNSL